MTYHSNADACFFQRFSIRGHWEIFSWVNVACWQPPAFI
jgi:hypothetical protein